MSTDEPRVSVSLESAMQRLAVKPDYDSGNGASPHVHTFRQGPIGILIGAHWPIEKIQVAIEKHGIEESGPAALAAHHGLVILDEDGALFVETLP